MPAEAFDELWTFQADVERLREEAVRRPERAERGLLMSSIRS